MIQVTYVRCLPTIRLWYAIKNLAYIGTWPNDKDCISAGVEDKLDGDHGALFLWRHIHITIPI